MDEKTFAQQQCRCVLDAHDPSILEPLKGSSSGCCQWSTDPAHCARIWECCFLGHEKWGAELLEKTHFESRRERLAEIMLGIQPPCIGGDVRDWEKGDESETMVHNMVSTSVVHGNRMPINLSQLAALLPCSTYDRKRFAAITIRIDHPRCTALLFTSGKLVITGVKSW